MTLTAKHVTKLITPGRYHDGHGLYLRVVSPTNRHWLLRYELFGRERWLGLGSARDTDLAKARERARDARNKLWDGVDPIDARTAERAIRALEAARTITFEKVALAYFDAHETQWSNAKHRAQFLSTLKMYAFRKIGSLPVAAIDVGLVLKVIEPIWHSKTETANRVRGRIESVLDYATVRGYRTGDNPARWKGYIENALPARNKVKKAVHHAALPFGEVPQFLIALRGRDGLAARAIEFLILCASRTGEVIGATWNEIDFAAKTWTIPADRMKAKKEHRVPLSDRALEILESLPREDGNPFVFIGPRKNGLSNMALAAVLRRMERRDLTIHGFRSSFRDWAAESTNHANFVVEMALAHAVANAVEAAYRRGDLLAKRTHLMADWARYCASEPLEAGAEVVPIRKTG
jgi:integrase